jgi:two-component SAPR family response regulator
MKIMKHFSFWIETTCLCNQQMNNIIQSFQTVDQLDCLTSLLYNKMAGVFLLIGENETVNKSFVKMLKQG